MIRPEVQATLLRWREVLIALALAGFGLWILSWGGLFYRALGGIVGGLGLGLALSAWRRLRFSQSGTGAGMVEVDEGQVSYFGPQTGGIVGLPDLTRIEMIPMGSARAWRLVPREGAPLTIPTDAQGAEALFDVIVALPGARPQNFLAALSGAAPTATQVLWHRASTHTEVAIARP